jgi:hypothetical protein
LARLRVLTAIRIQVAVFYVVTPEDGSNMIL